MFLSGNEYISEGILTKEATDPVVHCMVHTGFDAGEHEDFEAYMHSYIHYIASTVGDILLFVSDGESFDEEQVRQFELIRLVEGISIFVSLHDGGIGDILLNLSHEFENSEEIYFKALENNGLSRVLYMWCKENIDLTEIGQLAENRREHKKIHMTYGLGDETRREWLDTESDRLHEWEKTIKNRLDISALAKKALSEISVLEGGQTQTSRNMRNRPRFIRLYQHAMRVLGRERVREIFIADAEGSFTVPIEPVTHFRNEDRTLSPTPVADMYPQKIFHTSEEVTYGNATLLRDGLTYALSLSRHRKLMQNQPLEVLRSMNFPLTPNTRFIFSGEYRGRCVHNVAKVMRDRLEDIGGKYIIADDSFTLLHPDDDGTEEEDLQDGY